MLYHCVKEYPEDTCAHPLPVCLNCPSVLKPVPTPAPGASLGVQGLPWSILILPMGFLLLVDHPLCSGRGTITPCVHTFPGSRFANLCPQSKGFLLCRSGKRTSVTQLPRSNLRFMSRL